VGNAAGVEINGKVISGPLTISGTSRHSATARGSVHANREHGSRARADHDIAVCHPQPSRPAPGWVGPPGSSSCTGSGVTASASAASGRRERSGTLNTSARD
jgi:hypothetical protein